MCGLTVVIPFGGRPRLPLLDAVLSTLRRSAGVDQIVVSELGSRALAYATAARWQADYVFTLASGPFNKSRAMNIGARLARRPEILWLDGDLLFGEQFVSRALEEFRASGLDHLFPFSGIHYLPAAATQAVLDGSAHPADCQITWVLEPMWGGAPGAMGLIRAEFLARHGGMIETFVGWGGEDVAWVHKVSLLGRIGKTRLPDQTVWHLYHADSGSNDSRAAAAAQQRTQNAGLTQHIQAISSAADFSRQFPPATAAPPWPAECRISFVVVHDTARDHSAALAVDWSRRIGLATNAPPPVVHAEQAGLAAMLGNPVTDAVVVFAEAATSCAIASAGVGWPGVILVPSGVPHLGGPIFDGASGATWVLARTASERVAWLGYGLPVWHQPSAIADGDGCNAAPTLMQPLSELLGRPRHWSVAIPIDRAGLTPAALDRPKLWCVAFQDADGVELARQDANHRELHRLLAAPSAVVLIERRFTATRRPASWSIWLTDRAGAWLQQLSAPAQAISEPCPSTSQSLPLPQRI